jgi:hypothetical protein
MTIRHFVTCHYDNNDLWLCRRYIFSHLCTIYGSSPFWISWYQAAYLAVRANYEDKEVDFLWKY